MSQGSVVRLPRLFLGPEVYLAQDLADIVDWGLSIHGIPDSWLTAGKGEGIVVGVADTGRPDHEDLDVAYAANFTESVTDKDRQGHSSHVCGTIAARENGKGVVGVAPKATLITAKVLGDDGSGDSLGVARGVDWLVRKGANIINMSLGGPHDKNIASAVRDAVAAGVLVICAAGNEGEMRDRRGRLVNTVGYPARLPETLAVASYNKLAKLSDYSSRGKEVDVAFPGENILSCWPGNRYRRISGTSMASPFATGVAALLLGLQRTLRAGGEVLLDPVTDAASLKHRMRVCSQDKGPLGHDEGWGHGILDVPKFLDVKTQLPPAKPQPAEPAPSETDLDYEIFGMRFRYPVEVDGETGLFITL